MMVLVSHVIFSSLLLLCGGTVEGGEERHRLTSGGAKGRRERVELLIG